MHYNTTIEKIENLNVEHYFLHIENYIIFNKTKKELYETELKEYGRQ